MDILCGVEIELVHMGYRSKTDLLSFMAFVFMLPFQVFSTYG